MIPTEFEQAEFATYTIHTDTQRNMFESITKYLERFDELKDQPHNSFGFISKYGEQKLKEIKLSAKREEAKKIHNNFGLGKTHLQIAAAKQLINRGYSVIIISDVAFMEEITKSKTYDDEGEVFNRMIHSVTKADVLVWDDIGKSKPSDSKYGTYYRIIDDRYRNKKPILFSSNEDAGTLSERIGDASASRLFGMSKANLYAVEGQDFRLYGA